MVNHPANDQCLGVLNSRAHYDLAKGINFFMLPNPWPICGCCMQFNKTKMFSADTKFKRTTFFCSS